MAHIRLTLRIALWLLTVLFVIYAYAVLFVLTFFYLLFGGIDDHGRN